MVELPPLNAVPPLEELAEGNLAGKVLVPRMIPIFASCAAARAAPRYCKSISSRESSIYLTREHDDRCLEIRILRGSSRCAAALRGAP